MAFPVPIASVLTGATIGQLAYWRKHTGSARPLPVPEGKRDGRISTQISLDPGFSGRTHRVPFDVIAQLAEDKLDSAEIAAIYPSVEPEAITDATAFAKQVAAAA